MSAHTPGPWETVFEGHRLSVWAEGHGFIHTHETPQVNLGATRTANANARLIATAPDLLNACMMLVQWDDDSEGIYSEHNPKVRKIVVAARAAIAKAEGK